MKKVEHIEKSFHNTHVTRSEWIPNRQFKPSQLYSAVVQDDKYETSEYSSDWSLVMCHLDNMPCPVCHGINGHADCIVVAVDGASRGNGTDNAKGAIGVFFGPTSRYNVSLMLIKDTAPTNQKAELCAGIVALRKCLKIQAIGVVTRYHTRPLKQVVVKSDSEYLVKGMTDLIFKWKRIDGMNHKGEPIKNYDLFRRLDYLVRQLNDKDVEVLFWLVKRERNKDADRLANHALGMR
ncbi:ribonuclease H-like domain-containing protein [Calycina marina]|uniref:ribonuclease H n=1 Tax=Calycina marina TaxID=1763456 RepID=A0A9P8CIZ4_9HELO|nr:ribonuclease H-like domain-containing protein [Calycina marina]